MITFGAASELFYPGTHGSTFGGNALGTAVAGAVLGEIERADLVRNAAERGVQLREAIAGIESDLIIGCRGTGLLIGVGLRHPVAKALVAAAQEHGLVINAPNDETIRLVPALTIGDVEIDEFVELFTAALHTVEDALVLDASTEVSA
jgi:acetylornithine aminotransferase